MTERNDVPPFADRDTAGRQLAQHLLAKRDREPAFRPDLVLAIPRGGVAVAAPVAAALDLPLDVLVARKVGAPLQPELSIGAVTRFGEEWNQDVIDSLQLSKSEVRDALAQAERELGIREERFRAERPVQPIVERSVVLVDDGWATGATAASAVQGLLRSGVSNVIVTTPVAPPEAVARLEATGAETVVLETPAKMRAVGEFYLLFFPVTTDQCISLLIADRQSRTAI